MASASEQPIRRAPATPSTTPEAAQGRRLLSIFVLFATAMLVAIAVTLGVIAHNPTVRGKNSTVSIEAESPAEVPAAPEKPPAPPAPAPPPNQTTKLLESVAALCAVQLYQSHLNVGLLADAVEHDTYPKAEAMQILGTIVALSQTVDGQIKKLADAGLDKEDVDALERVRKASELVRDQAASLRSFWESGDKQHVESYRTARARCWRELQAILGSTGHAKK